MLFAGAPAAAAYLSRRFFAAAPAAETLGSVPVWRLAGELAAAAERSTSSSPASTASRRARARRVVCRGAGVGRRAGPRARRRRAVLSREKSFTTSRSRLSGPAYHRSCRMPRPISTSSSIGSTCPAPASTRRGERREQPRAPPPLFRQGGIMWIRHGEERFAGLLFPHPWTQLGPGSDRHGGRALRPAARGRCLRSRIPPLRACAAIRVHDRRFRHLAAVVARRSPAQQGAVGSAYRAEPDDLLRLSLSWDQLGAPLVDFLARTPLIFRQADGLAALWASGDTGIRAARHLLRSLRRIYLLDDAVVPGPDTELPVVRVDLATQPCWRPSPMRHAVDRLLCRRKPEWCCGRRSSSATPSGVKRTPIPRA